MSGHRKHQLQRPRRADRLHPGGRFPLLHGNRNRSARDRQLFSPEIRARPEPETKLQVRVRARLDPDESMTNLRIDSRLRADFSWVLSGNVIYSACQWGIVLLLAKLGNAEQVGLYALGMAVSAPIILFANLQVRTLLASDVKDEFRFGQYLAFRFVSLFLALLAIVAVAVWTTPDWLRRGVIILVGFAQILEYVSETYYGLMQKFDRMDRMSRSLMVKGPLALTVLCAAMYYTRNVAWAVVGLVLGRLFIVLVWDSRLDYIKNFTARLEWNSQDMLRLLRMSLPLGGISMLASFSANIPRYFIEGHLG